MRQPFNSIYSHGFIRAAVCVPFVRVADPTFNAARTIELALRASATNAAVALSLSLGLLPTLMTIYSSRMPCSTPLKQP
jgi:NAD+ synthase (glutamine-hydrolysing)